MRLTPLILGSICLLIACGPDDTSTPIEHIPNYFPDTIGSRWIYRNPDGSKWEREVFDQRAPHGETYQVLGYTPPRPKTEFDYLKPDVFRTTQNQILFAISEKIDRYIQKQLPALAQDEFEGLDLHVAIESNSYPEFLFLQRPLMPDSQWDVFNVNVSGNIVLQNLVLLRVPFEVLVAITA